MKAIITFLIILNLILLYIIRMQHKRINYLISSKKKNYTLYNLMSQWLSAKYRNASISNFLLEKGYKKIVISGMNHTCECLCDELKNSGVTITYIIDNNSERIYDNIEVRKTNEPTKKVDAVIVTRIAEFSAEKDLLEKKYDCPIISLKDIIETI